MSLAEILEEVDHLTDGERTELAGDAKRTADMSARLDSSLAGKDSVTEGQLLSRLRTCG